MNAPNLNTPRPAGKYGQKDGSLAIETAA